MAKKKHIICAKGFRFKFELNIDKNICLWNYLKFDTLVKIALFFFYNILKETDPPIVPNWFYGRDISQKNLLSIFASCKLLVKSSNNFKNCFCIVVS